MHSLFGMILTMQNLEDDLQMLGMKIKQHEENKKMLNNQKNKLEDSILDMQVSLGKYHSSTMHGIQNNDDSHNQSDEETIRKILQHERSAAGILCKLTLSDVTDASDRSLTKDVVGIVATLGKVDDDNLSR
uniref:Protein DEFECTIVE IN MERISTEM SILENCING 3 isoform X2 n=1 Tax=Rhizophora mucronata TaxID=61149 RepID=A0A2P2KHT4_RHIMU